VLTLVERILASTWYSSAALWNPPATVSPAAHS